MTPQQGVSNAVLLEKIENLREDLAELSKAISYHLEAQVKFEQQSYSDRQLLKAQVDNHEKEIAELRTQVRKLTDMIRPLIVTNRILTWLGGILMASVVALIWGILTHQVLLIFP